MWVHVAGKMELLAFEVGLGAEGHVNMGNYVIYPRIDDNRVIDKNPESRGKVRTADIN